MSTARDHAQRDRDAALARLMRFLAIPSVSAVRAHAGDVQGAAEWLAARMAEAGIDGVRVDPTPGHPVVTGRLDAGPERPTVLVYGHYDVQPPEPLEAWNSPPFVPTLLDGAIVARGAADDKGQLMAHVEAAAACMLAGGPPVNLRYVFEGEEEVGSPNLAEWLRDHADELAADVAVISDTAMLSASQPSIVYGLRGLAYFEIEVVGPNHDLHSGAFGGATLNPAGVLCRILSALQDAEGRVLIPGFYDRVRPLGDDERDELARVPFDVGAFRTATGAAGGWGEPGYSLVERLGARPSLDINGLISGWTGEGAKTVLPARALAKVSMRLVPDQDPEDIAERVREAVAGLTPQGASATVRALHGARPAVCDRSHPAMQAAARAYADVFGTLPVFTREGGSIPVVTLLDELLGIPTVLMGFGLPDDGLHGPNEKFAVAQFWRGTETVIAFLEQLASAGVERS